MITNQDRIDFQETGLIALRGYNPRSKTGKIRDHILSELSRLNLRESGKFHSAKFSKMPTFQQTVSLSGRIQMGPELDSLFPPEIFKEITGLADSNLISQHPHAQLLLSLPQKEDWSVKNLNWHLDYKNSRMDIMPGIQVFALIDDLKPQGGATLALQGSHRLHQVLKGHNAHGVLKQSQEFNQNPESFLETKAMHGVPVKIFEMSGSAGDVFLMDLRVLHTPSVNALDKPRMMATNRYLKPGLKL